MGRTVVQHDNMRLTPVCIMLVQMADQALQKVYCRPLGVCAFQKLHVHATIWSHCQEHTKICQPVCKVSAWTFTIWYPGLVLRCCRLETCLVKIDDDSLVLNKNTKRSGKVGSQYYVTLRVYVSILTSNGPPSVVQSLSHNLLDLFLRRYYLAFLKQFLSDARCC